MGKNTIPYQTLNISLLELNEGQLAGLPKNPRWIKDERYNALKKSIEDAPELLEARTLLVYPLENGHYVVIGGNMRLRACRELGFKELPCYVFKQETPVEKLREYTIKDNVEFGNVDWDLIANEWDTGDVQDWGQDISFLGEKLPDEAYDFSDDNVDNAKKVEKVDRNLCKCPICGHIANKKEFAYENISVSTGDEQVSSPQDTEADEA